MYFFSCGRSFGWQALLDLDLESAGDQHFSPCLQIAQGQTYTGIKEKMYRLFIADSAVFRFAVSLSQNEPLLFFAW